MTPEEIGGHILDIRAQQRELQQIATKEIMTIVDAPSNYKDKLEVTYEKNARRNSIECTAIRQAANQLCRELDIDVRKLISGASRVILFGREEYLAA